MEQIVVPSYNLIVQESIQKYWDCDSMSDYGLFTFKYKDVAEIIEKFGESECAEECGCLYELLEIIDKYKGESEG
jgi:hypothetical protein